MKWGDRTICCCTTLQRGDKRLFLCCVTRPQTQRPLTQPRESFLADLGTLHRKEEKKKRRRRGKKREEGNRREGKFGSRNRHERQEGEEGNKNKKAKPTAASPVLSWVAPRHNLRRKRSVGWARPRSGCGTKRKGGGLKGREERTTSAGGASSVVGRKRKRERENYARLLCGME